MNLSKPTALISMFWLGVYCLFLLPSAALSRQLCGEAQYQKAEKALEQVNDWETLHRFYKQYPHCDDGYLGEGYSDRISSLFANRWSDIERTLERMHEDKAYKAFLLKHINSTVQEESLEKIAKNTQAACPPKLQSECLTIRKDANDALKYQPPPDPLKKDKR